MLCSAPVGLTRQSSRGIGPTAGYDLQSVHPHFLFLLLLLHVLFPVTSCHSPPALVSEPVSSSSLSAPSGPDVWGMEVTSDPRPRALSVLAVRPELDALYRKMNEQNRGEGPGMVCAMCEINL